MGSEYDVYCNEFYTYSLGYLHIFLYGIVLVPVGGSIVCFLLMKCRLMLAAHRRRRAIANEGGDGKSTPESRDSTPVAIGAVTTEEGEGNRRCCYQDQEKDRVILKKVSFGIFRIILVSRKKKYLL